MTIPYNALYLNERINHKSVNYKIKLDKSVIIKKWKQSFPFNVDNKLWNRKLKAEKLKELEISPFLRKKNCNTVKMYFKNRVRHNIYFSSVHSEIKLSKFFDLINDEIIAGQKRLFDNMLDNKLLTFQNPMELLSIMSFSLADQLFSLISRVLVLELNVDKFLGKLSGESSEERFDYFMNSLSTIDKQVQIFKEYPLLFRNVHEIINSWESNSFEFLQRLNSDISEINEYFGLNANTRLVKVQIGAGDRHNNGKTVILLHYEDGKKLVYKPRSINTETHFNELIDYINTKNLKLKLKTYKTLDKGSYGWVEFINHEPCEKKEDITEYYIRLGYFLGIFFSINATDFHFENIIANGKFPIFVDLETIFNPYLVDVENQKSNVTNKIYQFIYSSVLSTAILPWRAKENGESVDISGLMDVSANAQTLQAAWQAEGSDDMSLIRKMTRPSGANNVPMFEGKSIKAFEYFDDILIGFKDSTEMIINNKDEIAGDNGILKIFRNDTIRILVRDTRFYGQLLNTLQHPDYLRNSIDREMLYDYLWAKTSAFSILNKLVVSEKKSLMQNDIPLFTTKVNSRDIRDTFGNIYKYCFENSGFDVVKNRILNLNSAKIEDQIWLIKASLENHIKPKQKETRQELKPNVSINRSETIRLLKEVHTFLIHHSFKDESGMNWIGAYPNLGSDETTIRTLGLDIYNGLPGVCLFFAFYDKINKTENSFSEVNKILKVIEDDIKDISIDSLTSLGTFNGGISGLSYLYTSLYTIYKENKHLDKAVYYAELIDYENCKQVDIIDGKAGMLLTLINCYKISNSPSLWSKAEALTKSICKSIVDTGLYNAQTPEIIPAGFAHGLAGINYALYKFYELKRDNNLLKLISDILVIENKSYDNKIDNWKDKRNFEIEGYNSQGMVAWCNGPCGIGISRVAIAKEDLLSTIAKSDIEICTKRILKDGFGLNSSLCHGDWGNLELLIQCNKINKNLMPDKRLSEISDSLFYNFKNHGFEPSTSMGHITYGLMTGIAGVGYQMLRVLFNDKVPSVLNLDIQNQ